MSSKRQDIKVTFGKRVKGATEDYQTILVNGEEVGYLYTRRTCNRWLTVGLTASAADANPNVWDDNQLFVCEYAVELAAAEEVTFPLNNLYDNARSVLAAAKRYAKETLTLVTLETQHMSSETRVEEINAEVKHLRASASNVKDVEEEVLALERERADLLYGTEEPPAPTKHVCGLCGKTLTPCKDGKLRRHNSAPGVQCDGSYQVAGTEVAWGAEVERLKAAPDLQISLTSEELQICVDYGYEDGLPSSLNPWEAYSVACCLRTATWSTLEEGSAHLASLLDKLTLAPAEPLVKGFTEAPAPAPQEEERALRVTPPQTSALRALGYEVRSYKLRYYPSQVEEMVQRLYAERENHTRGNRRIYTSLIERLSTPRPKIKRAKGAPRARFSSGDLSIEYSSQEVFTQFVQLVDAAESTKLITRASAEALRSALRAPAPDICDIWEERLNSLL